MYKNRPMIVVTLGYIIGIIWGLYFKTNIVFLYAIILVLKYIKVLLLKRLEKGKSKKFKFISIKKIFRYIKLILDFKSLIIIILISIISNLIITSSSLKYENLYSGLEDISIIAKVIDNGKNKEYKTTYKIKVEKVDQKEKFKGTYLYLDVSNKISTKLRYGDYIIVQGKYNEPSKQTNYQGFDYSKYLRTLKVYGSVKASKIELIQEDSNNILFTISNNISIKIKDTVKKSLSEEKSNLLLGILIGYKDEIPEEMQENFKESNISHILAVSGLHVSYIILAISKVLEKSQGKRRARILTVFFIIAYMFITNFSPSVVRAGLMGIISIIAQLTYNKSDIWTSMSISLLCILIYNPYLITSAGVLLSYGGTIGIILFQRNILEILKKLTLKIKKYVKNAKMIDYLNDTIAVSFSAQLAIAPIIAKMFNTVSLSFFIPNFFVSIIIGPIIILGFLFIIFSLLFSDILKIFLEKLLDILILISKLGKSIPFNKIYITTPETWKIVIYYIVILILNIFYKISIKRKRSTFENRLINWKNLIRHLIRKNISKVATIIVIIFILIISLEILPRDLKIYFIDVGQGDSTLIVTPSNKSILIDGGGSENYDVGQNTMLPYLLDRKIRKVDYVIISHFDTDHVGGILTILSELNVKKVIIAKQYEASENYEEFLRIVKQRKIPVKVVSKGDKINIEKDVQIQVLFPEEKQIEKNALNNNSLVLKLSYKNFSMLFTGDVEAVAEERLVEIYKNTNSLNTTILKIAHHGSKTSSIQEFLKLAQPKIAVIGVGEKNLYGHPNPAVIDSLIKLRNKNL